MKYIFLAFIATLLLSGCGLIEDDLKNCPGQSVNEGNVRLCFKMISSNIGSSRADAVHEETDSSWPEFEDLIEVDNFAFYVFLDNVPDKPLVMKMTDIGHSDDPFSLITGSYGAYTVTSIIPKENLEKLLGHEITADSTGDVTFRIVLLANAAEDTDYDALAPLDPITAGTGGNPTTYDEFIQNAEQMLFNENSIYNAPGADTEVKNVYTGAIPMFGMSTFTTTEELLFASRPEERIYLGDIYMLRALAKVEVVDNAPKNAEGYPRVISAVVTGVTDMLYQLPAGADTYINEAQVHDTRFAPRSGSTANVSFRLGTLPDSPAVRIGYIPEQAIQFANPVIRVTAQLDEERQNVYDIPMTGNELYNVSFGEDVLRNHIYTLSVNRIDVGTPVDLDTEVQEWSPYTYNIDFTQSLTIPNKLQWQPSSYLSLEPGGVVIMKPWTTSPDGTPIWSPLVGTFGIQSPVGAHWTAYMISLTEQEHPFAFLDKKNTDENGNPTVVTSISGDIDGKSLSELTIISMDPTPAVVNKARLQIVVTIGEGASGSIIEADITPENTSYKYFTILQNP